MSWRPEQTDRIELLKRHMPDLRNAGVRGTTHFGVIERSLEASVGEAPRIRRAKAFAVLLEGIEPTILPHELTAFIILSP